MLRMVKCNMSLSTPKPLGDSLAAFLKSKGWQRKVKEFEALGHWNVIVGGEIADATEAGYVSEGVIYIKVKNSSWRNELTYLKKDILCRIEKRVGSGIIKDIRYIY